MERIWRMGQRVVIDTSILIDYLRRGPNWQKFLMNTPESTELFLPTIVIYELFSGKSTKNRKIAKDIYDLIKLFIKIELDEGIAIKAGELYREGGKKFSAQDYIIAASALKIGASVLTLNKKHFEQIPQLGIYPLS